MSTLDAPSTPPRDLGLTFAGGGNRAFYQLGLMHRWGDALLPRVAAIAACSAGACVAALMLSGRHAQAAEYWRWRVRDLRRNLDWTNLLRGRSPAPHGPIYRDTLLHAAAEGGLERLRAQPFPILALTAASPRLLPVAAAVPLGLAAYNLEKRLRKAMMHPTLGRRLGFRPVVFDLRDCCTPSELADVVIASSSTPPFTPVGRCGPHRSLLDGGMIDNVPADVADAAAGVSRNVVLLTRPYPAALTGVHGTRLYLAPSRPVPADRWDYTRPHLVDATIAMGEDEAALHAPALERFLGDLAPRRTSHPVAEPA